MKRTSDTALRALQLWKSNCCLDHNLPLPKVVRRQPTKMCLSTSIAANVIPSNIMNQMLVNDAELVLMRIRNRQGYKCP